MSAFGGKADMGCRSANEGQRFGAVRVASLETVKCETCIFDQILNCTIEMAATAYPFPSRSEMVLPPTHIRFRGAAMFDKKEPSGRTEHPMHFTKCTTYVRNAAQSPR